MTDTAVDGWLKVNGNVTITDIVVTATAKIGVVKDNSEVAADGYSIDIAFNMAVLDETGAALEAADFTAPSGKNITGISVVDDQTIRLTFDQALADNDTVKVNSGKAASAADKGNKTGADITITITKGSDGAYSIKSVA